MKIFIVIPAYNEENKIGKVVKELITAGYKNVVVIDDGSKDNTFKVAKSAGAITLRHVINRGQGAGLQTGITYALNNGAGIIVTYDADGQHSKNDLPAIIKPVRLGQVDAALGSRFRKTDSNTPPIRKLFLKGGALLFRIFYGVNLSDSHNGFRALSRNAAKKINITSDDMAHASEIIDEISRKNIKYVEVPVTITYTDYSLAKGQNTLNGFKILWRMLLDQLLK